MPLFLLAFVFAKGHVAHPMQPIFDAPMTTPMVVQKGGVGPLSRKLLIANWISTVVRPLQWVVRSRRQTCVKPGQSRRPASRALACKCRCTLRPCPFDEVRTSDSDACRCFSVAGGKTGPKFRFHGGFQLGLIVFDDEQIVAAAIDDLRT